MNPTREDLIEAKKSLYKIFVQINPHLITDDEVELLAAISHDKDIQKILEEGRCKIKTKV